MKRRSTPGSEGQRSRSREAEVRFGGLAEALFLTPLGRVAFLVSRQTLFNPLRPVYSDTTQLN